MEQKHPCIAMVPCPGLSHLIPQLEFAKRLIHLHPEFHVTLLIPTLGSPSATTHSLLKSLPPQIHFTFLPQINIQDLPPNVDPVTQMQLTVTRSLPSVSQALTKLQSESNLVALVVNLFSVDALDLAKKLDISSYVLYASAAVNLSFLLYLPTLHEILSRNNADLSLPLKLPGSSIELQGKDLPDLVYARGSPYYATMLHLSKALHKADAIAINTFAELEPEAMKTFPEINSNLPAYPVGPIIQSGSTARETGLGSECLEWLDKQPKNSVLYICFGSGGSLSYEQTTELAFGLEMSGQRFIWVVRPPSGSSTSAYLSSEKDNNDPFNFLPDGFVGRIKDRGFLVQSWCPQIDVMRHESTCGFLTHCGWSSTLESLANGKPTIVWPLFGDQPVNAAMLTDTLKVAVRAKADEKDGIVKREEVGRVVKCVLESDEGKYMYKRVQVVKDAAATALGENGSSTKNLEIVVGEWMEKVKN